MVLRKIIRNENAVSESIGMVFILSISMLIIGSIMIVGLPMIDSGKNRAKMDILANSFLFLQNDIDEVVRGPIWIIDPYNVTNVDRLAPSRETEFELMDGSISIFPNNTGINWVNTTDTIIIPSSNIVFDDENNEKILYENGAIIRKYDAGEPLMISEPLINIYDAQGENITVSIHAITLNGKLSSVGGKGKAIVEIRLKNYTQVIEPTSSPNINQTIIKIYSKYPDVWKNYIETKLTDAGLRSSFIGNTTGYNISGTYPLNIQIYGKVINNSVSDIFLSVYESKLDIKVR